MSTNQPSDMGPLMTAIKEMTDEVKETVRVMNARADKEDPSRDMLIRTYKQVSNTHLEIIRRLEAGYKELSDAAIKQSQARRRDERPVVTQKEDLRWNTDTSRNELQAENTELKSEVETLQAENTKLKEEQTRLQHEAAAHAKSLPSEHTTPPIGGLTGQNQAQSASEENATPRQHQFPWEDALSYARAIVSTAVGVAVIAGHANAVANTYPCEFAMNCTDFLYIIHSQCPDESLRTLNDKWPPKWLKPGEGTGREIWAKFGKDIGSDVHGDQEKMMEKSQPGGQLGGKIQERLKQCPSFEGTWSSKFAPTRLVGDLLVGDQRVGLAEGS